MINPGELTLTELASYVATHLEKNGIPVVLVGGSCVAIYATDQYTTKDLDFIEQLYTRRTPEKSAGKDRLHRTTRRQILHT